MSENNNRRKEQGFVRDFFTGFVAILTILVAVFIFLPIAIFVLKLSLALVIPIAFLIVLILFITFFGRIINEALRKKE